MQKRTRHRITQIMRVATCLIALPLTPLRATEYFVDPAGSNGDSGLTPTNAFATIQRGVDTLQPGDTLTILPGEYREAVSRTGLGDDHAETTIRAALPGTVLIRGDEPAPAFEPVDGRRFIHAAPFPREPQAVNEVDTLTRFNAVLALPDLEFEPGRFFYDADRETLYVSSSDLLPPDQHVYSVSTIAGRAGIFLRAARRVVIEGLSATGFSARNELPQLPSGNALLDHRAWGFYLSHCRATVIRNCTVFMNQAGIGSHTGWTKEHGHANRIENCTGVHNSLHVFNPTRDVVRDSRVWGVSDMGITTHGRGYDTRARFEGSFCWSWYPGRVALQMKSPGDQRFAHRCIAPDKMIQVAEVTHSLLLQPLADPHPSNIYTALEPDLDRNAEFADPVNHDYRLQATSRFRGTGPDGSDKGPHPYEANVFFVKPDGDDEADGLSMARAWRSLARATRDRQPGDTIYLAPGTYEGALDLEIEQDAADPLSIRGRGTEAAVLRSTVRIRGAGRVAFQRIRFEQPVALRGDFAAGGPPHGGGPASPHSTSGAMRGAQSVASVSFRNCRFNGGPVALTADSVEGLRVTHCEFTAFTDCGISLTNSRNVFLQGNVFAKDNVPAVRTDRAEAILYSGYNSSSPAVLQPRGPSGHAPGPWRMDELMTPPLRVSGPFLHSASATSANLEWWSSKPETFTVRWGTTPEATNRVVLAPIYPYHPHGTHLDTFNTFSLAGLKPGTRYHVRVLHDGAPRGALTFTTSSTDPPGRTLHVAPDGDDGANGLTRNTAWRTVSHAADRVRPGDTVLISGGTYHESVRLRVSGTPEAPIVFRAAPGEPVVFDGQDHVLNVAFNVFNKSNVTFDGLYFRNYRRIWTRGLFNIVRGSDIAVTRCFADGRLTAGGSTPELVTGGGTRNLLIRNCVQLGGWGFVAYGAPDGLRIENNVVLRVSINPIGLGGGLGDVIVRHNIIGDNLPKKRLVSLSPFGDITVAPVTLQDNCFFLRWPEEERGVFGDDGGTVAAYEASSGGQASGNLVADPRFACDPPEDGIYAPDRMMRAEFPLDFGFLFARNPELTERGIGLQPAAFADFHFNRQDQANRPRPEEVAIVTASHNSHPQTLLRLSDGDTESRWATGAYQEPGMWLAMRFAQPKSEVHLSMTGTHPTAYDVYTDCGDGWEASPQRIDGVEGPTATIDVTGERPIAAVKLVIAEPHKNREWWVISEMTVNGETPVLF